MREQDVEIVELHAKPPSLFVWSLITKTYLSGFTELFDSVYTAQIPGLPSRADIDQKLARLMEACQKKGSQYHWTPVSVLGQKAN